MPSFGNEAAPMYLWSQTQAFHLEAPFAHRPADGSNGWYTDLQNATGVDAAVIQYTLLCGWNGGMLWESKSTNSVCAILIQVGWPIRVDMNLAVKNIIQF